MSDIKYLADGCIRKKRYRTEGIAEQVAEKVLRERGAKVRAYYCPVCLGWHLTRKYTEQKETSNG